MLSLVLAAFGLAFYFVYARSRLAALDEELARAGALVARLVPPDLDEGIDLAEAAHDAVEDIETPGRSIAVFDGAGALLAGQATAEAPAGAFRVHRARHRHRQTAFQVVVAQSLAPVRKELAGLWNALLGSFAATLLLAVVGGWWIARGALRPVELMAAQARRITDRTPGFRLDSPDPGDELGLLAEAFNGLLARLESALAQQRQFMADASHELRTPVSVARTAMEVTLSRPGRPEEEYRDSLGVVAEQMRRLSRTVEDLFTLARADVAGLALEPAPLYLDDLVADCVKAMRVLAGPKGIALDWRGPRDLEIRGDERLLRQMLVNLLDNAIRHAPGGRRVLVELAAGPDAVAVAVTDDGPGIRQEERERVFQRFVRLDASRRSGDGAGLGLPIARAIAEAHGGTLVLTRSDASGSTFLAELPGPR